MVGKQHIEQQGSVKVTGAAEPAPPPLPPPSSGGAKASLLVAQPRRPAQRMLLVRGRARRAGASQIHPRRIRRPALRVTETARRRLARPGRCPTTGGADSVGKQWSGVSSMPVGERAEQRATPDPLALGRLFTMAGGHP